jgi:hypothetical protein
MYSNNFYETSTNNNNNNRSSTPSTLDSSWDSYNSGDDHRTGNRDTKSNQTKTKRRVSHSSSIGKNDYEQFDNENDDHANNFNNGYEEINNKRRKSIIKKSSKRKFSGNSSNLSSIGYSSMKHSLKHVSFK